MGLRWMVVDGSVVGAPVSYSATAYMMRRQVVCSEDRSMRYVHTVDAGL
jgi:hypothetical protein